MKSNVGGRSVQSVGDDPSDDVAHLWPHHAEHVTRTRLEGVVPAVVNLCNVQELKLTSLVHGRGYQELKDVLDFGRLGVKQGSESLEFRRKIIICVFHVSPRLGSVVLDNDGQVDFGTGWLGHLLEVGVS